MQYKKFKDIELSRLGMGNMRLPIQAGGPDSAIDMKKGQEIIDYAMANGINYYDTAYVYHGGASERFLGEVLVKRYPREQFYIATKFNIGANPDYKAVFAEQLERLQTDYIDFYLIHAVMEQNCRQYLDSGCIEYFLEKQKEGKIKYLGFSSHADLENLKLFASHHQWDFAQIQMNYYDWMYGSTEKEYEILEEKNIPIMVMEPCRGGRLASLTPETEKELKAQQKDWSIASWAFRFVEKHPQIQVVLSGMGNMEQIIDNVATFSDDYVMTEKDEKVLLDVCKKFHSQVIIPCTACRYCCEGCPAQINIPVYLDLYNRYKLQGEWVLTQGENIDSKGTPQDCIGCGACTDHCPQGIDVPAVMEEFAEVFRNLKK